MTATHHIEPLREEPAASRSRDHREVVGALGAEARSELLERSDWAGLAHLAGHAGAIAIVTSLIVGGVPFWWALLPIQGVLLIALFAPLHESVHETAFRSHWLNRAVSSVCGFVVLLPPTWFRAFHFAHHRHTQDPERDPELAVPKPATWPEYLLHLSGIPVWTSQIRALLRNASGRVSDAFVPERARSRVIAEARVFVGLYAALFTASVAAGGTLLLWTWVVPVLLGQPFLRAYLLAEHGRCPMAANMFENTRTTFTSRLVRFLAWNMPYHAEHHALPSVPFHRLPRLHAIVSDDLRVTEQGYARFHRRNAPVFR